MMAHYNNLIKIHIQDSKFGLHIKIFLKNILMDCAEKLKSILFRYLSLV
jgi:hypothetical protein